MLELFLKLVDRVINLQERRLDKRKELFKSLVEPSFDEVSSVYSDYRAMLRGVAELIQRGDIDEAIARLENDREKYLTTRTKLRSMAASVRPPIADFDPTGQVSFAELVSIYLSQIGELILARATQHAPRHTFFTTLIEKLRGGAEHTNAVEHLSWEMDATLRDLDIRFHRVSSAFGQLRAAAYLGDEMSFASPEWLQDLKKLSYQYRADEDD